MGRRDRSGTLAKFQKISFIFICATTPLAIFVLLLWVLGVPGVDNNYARGWAVGLSALVHYCLGAGLLLIAYGVVAKLVPGGQRSRYVKLAIISIFWLLFFYTGFNIVRAFQIMLAPS